jgi:hypothetical protein
MIIEAPRARYECISHLLHSQCNDVYVCREISGDDEREYLLNMVNDRRIAKNFLVSLGCEGRFTDCIDCFTWEENLCIIFRYIRRRSVDRFYLPEHLTVEECNTIFRNLVFACMTAQVPYPLLYLVLRQRRFNLEPDLSVTLDYCVDMSRFDTEASEEDCLGECLSRILIFLDRKDDDNDAAYKVLTKRYSRNSYGSFVELYNDMDNANFTLEKETFRKKLKRFWGDYGHRIWLVVKSLLFIIGIVAIILLVCDFLFGDIPFMRIFINSFKEIGERDLSRYGL